VSALEQSVRRQLERAYCNTNYVVLRPEGDLVIRIGEPCWALDELLNARGVREWAFVSASNPRSDLLCEQENLARHENLLRAVSDLAVELLPGESRADAADWPAERSVLLLGLSAATARALGKRFEQNAIVYGEVADLPWLIWCC
jgi:hypothetical protein